MQTTISLTRDSGYADKVRDYRVMLDGSEIGRIADGESKTFVVPAGKHELRLKIDWCGSNTVDFDLSAGASAAFRCGSSLRRLKLVLGLYYSIIARNRYVWLAAA
jgi:hypothetical protein